MNRTIYNSLISILILIFRSLFWVTPKWKERHFGLKNQIIEASAKRRLWFHCSSAGEYEQIANVVEALSEKHPNNPVLISFFSPSGIEWMKSKNLTWECVYLPFDGSQKIKNFIDQVNPKCLIVAKNELWFNLINITHLRNIPTFLVSASIRADFFALKSKFFRKHLSYITEIFAQDQATAELLSPHVKQVTLSGDTRISRIISKASSIVTDSPLLFSIQQPIVIYGSLHKEDLEILEVIKKFPDFNHVVVPHDISISSIRLFAKALGESPVSSSASREIQGNCLLVDEMGKLADLYRQSDYAYIGGGFTKGIHNIIEPLIHKNIVFIGPKHRTFHEAKELVAQGTVQVIDSPVSFNKMFTSVINLPEVEIAEVHRKAQQYINEHQHAAVLVVDKISSYLNEN